MKYALTLDLIDDPLLIAEYEKWHQQIWPEIKASIIESGIESMQIYRSNNRLFMLMEVDTHFTFEKKAKMDRENPSVQEWETMMWTYQQVIPEIGRETCRKRVCQKV